RSRGQSKLPSWVHRVPGPLRRKMSVLLSPHFASEDQLVPKTAAASSSLIYRPPSITERLDVATLFAMPHPLEVELGSGDGSFLAEYAARRPECNFIGVERLLGRLRKLDRKGWRAGLKNLRLLRIEASYVIKYLLPHDSVRVFHVYF